jgi:hypothetical protein
MSFVLSSQDLKRMGIEDLFELLSSAYPEHEWLPWKFHRRLPTGFWGDAVNQRKFVTWASDQLQIKEMSDWYKVSSKVNFQANIVFMCRI